MNPLPGILLTFVSMTQRGLKFFNLFAIFLYVAAFFTSVPLAYGADLLLFEKGGKQGLKDESGTVLIPAIYDQIGWSQGDMIPVDQTIGYRENNRWGLLNLKNKRITPPLFSKMYPGNAHLLITGHLNPSNNATLLGVTNTNGREILDHAYQSIRLTHEYIIAGHFAGSQFVYGLFALDGDDVLPVKYHRIDDLGANRIAAFTEQDEGYLLDQKGNRIGGQTWNEIHSFSGGRALIKLDHSFGVIDRNGKTLLPATLKKVELTGEGINATEFDAWLILNEHNEKLHEFRLDSLGPWTTDRWLACANGHEWIIDQEMHAVTPEHYADLRRVAGNLLIFKTADKRGVMTEAGEEILPAKFDSIYFEKERFFGLSVAFGRHNWQLYDQSGKQVSPVAFQQFRTEQDNGYIPVKRRDFWGFVDHDGNKRLEMVYDSVGEFVDGNVAVKFKGKYGIVNEHDEWMVTPQALPLTPINERFYYSRDKTLTTIKSYESGTVYFTNNEILFKEGYFIEKLKGHKFWKINYSGRIVNSPENLQQYEEIRLPSEGFIAVKMHGRYGFIDEQDRLRIAHRYDDVKDFHESHAGFKLLGKWGFIDKQERITVQPIYDDVLPYENGVSIVRAGNKYGLIDVQGNEIVRPEYESIRRENNDRFLIVYDGHTGLLDKTGRIIVNPKYDKLTDLDKGQVIASKHGRYGLLSRKGDILIPIMYDMITYDPYNDYYLAMKKTEAHPVPLR